jgi:DnaJ-class molecular chaperone
MNNWQARMKHERDWRDSGVELGLRAPPRGDDSHGSLACAGPLRSSSPALDARFAAKGHDSMIFESCRCHAVCPTCTGTGQDDPPPGKYHGLCPRCCGTGQINA